MVYPAVLNKNQLVAVKVFCLDNLTIKAVADFFRETLLSSNINHSNIVKFIGCCIRPPEICLIYEMCSHGDLASFIFTAKHNAQDAMNQCSSPNTLIEDSPLSLVPKLKSENFDDDQIDIDINYHDCQPQTMLSDNTTIPSVNSPRKSVFVFNPQSFQSPTDDSIALPCNTNLNRPHDEILNSMRAKALNNTNENVLSLSCRLLLLLDISKGMAFLHKKHMLHRDLKTANILIHYDSEQRRFIAKVCDFGSSRNVHSQQIDSESIKGKSRRSTRELSLTNFKRATHERKRSQKRRPLNRGFFAKLKASKCSFDDEVSCSMTATSTRFGTSYDSRACLADDAYYAANSNPQRKDKPSLLPEPRNLSTVAFTAPENLGHIDFSSYERQQKLDKSKRKKLSSFENEDCQLSLVSEPIEMNEDKDQSIGNEQILMRAQTVDIHQDSICDDGDVDLQTALKSDVYSFGVIVWEVICMKPIYLNMSMIEIRDFILGGKRMQLIEFDDLCYLCKHKTKRQKEQMQYDKVQKLMLECLQQNAKFRPSFQEIVKILHSIVYTGKSKYL